MKYVRVELLSCVIGLNLFGSFCCSCEKCDNGGKVLRTPRSCMLMYQRLCSQTSQVDHFYIHIILSRSILVARSSTKLKFSSQSCMLMYVVCQALFIYILPQMLLSCMSVLNKKFRRTAMWYKFTIYGFHDLCLTSDKIL